MNPVRRAVPGLAAASCALLAGCFQLQPLPAPRPRPRPVAVKDYYRPLPEGAHALRRITDPRDLPDLRPALRDRAGLREGVAASLRYLQKPSARGFFPVSGISHERVVASLAAFQGLLERDLDAEGLAAELARRFDVYTSVGCDDRGTVLFTGYYTPIFDAARERGGAFQHPLHRLPPDHVKDPITGETLGLRRADGTIDPAYPDRQALLASGRLAGHELAWLPNAFEAYIIGVQGSAILRLPDGRRLGVGYAGNNGHEYASIGMELVRRGKLTREQLNLRRLIEYFRAHPDEFEPIAAANRRYVFFQEAPGEPRGCLNEPVQPLRTIATDKSIFPRGALCLLTAALPDDAGYQGFAFDQDAGGAIRAPGRCDVYMGIGEEAGARAGRTLAEGRLYYLFLREDELTVAARQ